MTTVETQFFLYGDVPVMMERTPSGGLRVSALNPRTGEFVLDPSYRNAIFHDRDGFARPVSRTVFEERVHALRGPRQEPSEGVIRPGAQ
ncbi:hypothetical protein [Deinococcus ruber]|uniref:Uncharacterized protein n=1 Tax=Deinococcus ruber TaxID=1848197 RepID=A0A918F8B8_9DEIO|nr:hypothetical protein [Deinococcus ruber]GGR09953.1 hypothetical protein GCM10008957_23410 [Deinococcus ruber]